MLSKLVSLDQLTAIAHRGGAKLRPENTVLAFDHALTFGVDAVECDVHLARDGEVVVIHDPTLDRTTDRTGPVSALTARELRGVDAGFHFRPEAGYPFRGRGAGVPTLRELLARYPEVPFIIEVKGEDPAVGRGAIDVVREQRAAERVILGGFSHAVLRAVRELDAELVTSASGVEARAALTRSYFALAPKPTGFRLFQMPFRLRGRQMLRRSFVRAARRAGIPVQAWIVDEADEMRQLIEWGVTGIISDRPDRAVEVVRELRIEN
jgi:glycerophosphoryl diester phosphodiesterase